MEMWQLARFVIRPTLERMAEYRPSMAGPGPEALLLATVAVESDGGRYLHQLGHGPALSVFQIEPTTAVDLVDGYACATRPARAEEIPAGVNPVDAMGMRALRRPQLAQVFHELLWMCQPLASKPEQLCWNLALACATARLLYWVRDPEPCPEPFDLTGQWRAYKTFFNTEKGATTRKDFDIAWERHVAPAIDRLDWKPARPPSETAIA